MLWVMLFPSVSTKPKPLFTIWTGVCLHLRHCGFVCAACPHPSLLSCWAGQTINSFFQPESWWERSPVTLLQRWLHVSLEFQHLDPCEPLHLHSGVKDICMKGSAYIPPALKQRAKSSECTITKDLSYGVFRASKFSQPEFSE